MRHRIYRFIVIIAGLLGLPVLIHANTTKEPYTFDDWVPDPTGNSLCHGYYSEQSVPFRRQASPNLTNPPIEITSDEGRFISEGNSTLTGHVHLLERDRQVFADHAIILRDPHKTKPIDSIQAKGHVKLTEPGLRVDGTEASISVEPDLKEIHNANFRIYDRHARGEANCIILRGKDRMILKSATYTTCSPFQNTWTLKAKNIDLNKKTGRGRARHARLYVKDIPIFYIPYIDFPLDDRRQTGFLYPTFGITNRSGVELGAPFYWNIAPNYDATLTPRIYSKRGVELQGQFRYLLPNSQGELEGSFLPNDRAYRKFKEDNLANPLGIHKTDPRYKALNTGNNREAFYAKHVTILDEHWSANFQYQTVRDDNYFMDFGGNINRVNTNQLLQQGEILYRGNSWNMQTRLQQYQTLHPFEGPKSFTTPRRLPQIAVQNFYHDLPYGLQWAMPGEFSHFLYKDADKNPLTDGDRFQLRPSLSLPISQPSWFIKPRVQWDFLAYSLSVVKADRERMIKPHSSRIIPIMDLDTGLIFERNINLTNEPYIQTFEPRFYYLYVPFRDQSRLPIFDTYYAGFDYNQLFWDNRFTGLDRVGDANQVTTTLTTRFFNETTGTERFSLTAGQVLYFKTPKVTTCPPNDNTCQNLQIPNDNHHRSSWVGLARYAIQEDWIARANAEWDPYQKHVDKIILEVQYHPDRSSILNLGYQFLRRNPAKIDLKTNKPEKLDQTDVSSAWALTERWRLLGRWHYDLHKHQSNDISLGVEQHGCCTAVRIFVSRFLRPFDDSLPNSKGRYTNAIFLQFIFKGLAGVGQNKIDPTLKRAIPGYEWQSEGF